MRIAHSHVGICEATGHDDGPRIEQFQAVTGNYRTPWCSSHVADCFVEAHQPLPPRVTGKAASWFDRPHVIYAAGQWLNSPAPEGLPGDVFGFNNGGHEVHHVSLEASAWGVTATVYSLEGNYSNCVTLFMRPKRSIAVVARHLPL